MAPFFILMVSFVGIFLSADVAGDSFLSQTSSIIGSDVMNYLSEITSNDSSSTDEQHVGIVTGIIGFIILLYGVTRVFKELSYSMDKIWSTEPDKKPKRMTTIKQILVAVKKHIPILLLIIILALLFIVSIISSFSLQIFNDYLQSFFPNTFGLIQLLEPMVSFIFVALFFGVIYRVLPKTKLPLTEIAFGASVTAVVFLIGELIVSFYMGNFLDRSAFGAAGSLISIMIWVYISAQIFFFGASFTFIYSKRYGYLKKKFA